MRGFRVRQRAESFESTWDHGDTELVADKLHADIDALGRHVQEFATVARLELRE